MSTSTTHAPTTLHPDRLFPTVGVVGAGVMGTGIAQNLATTGHRAVVLDVSDDVLRNARRVLRSNLRGMALFGAERCDVDEALGRIDLVTDIEALADVDFVVENVTEDWAVKREVYPRLDAVCRPDVVFAVNTSAIPITRVGSVTSRPDRVVGMHFMNPVPAKPVVEVIRGVHTSEETLETAYAFLASIGKEGIVVSDSPGFVSNRVLMLMINEAIFLVQDRVSEPAEVDRIFRTCFEHRMGPLETADMIGLDTILRSVEVLHEAFGDDKYRPAPLLRQMVDAGYLGRKSGRGFHRYQ